MNTTCSELFLLIVDLQILHKQPDEDMDIDETRDQMHTIYVEIPLLSEDVLGVLTDSDI